MYKAKCSFSWYHSHKGGLCVCVWGGGAGEVEENIQGKKCPLPPKTATVIYRGLNWKMVISWSATEYNLPHGSQWTFVHHTFLVLFSFPMAYHVWHNLTIPIHYDFYAGEQNNLCNYQVRFRRMNNKIFCCDDCFLRKKNP